MSTDRKTRAEAAQDTTDRLLAVARATFAAKGFADASLDAIAAEAGVTRGALHHHFGNKAGLFEAVLRRMDAEVGQELNAGWDPALPSWTAWRAAFHQYLDAVQRPDRLKLFFCDGPAVLGAAAFELMLDSGLSEIVEGLAEPEVRAALTTADAEALHAAAPEPRTIRWYDAGHALDRRALSDRHAWLHEQIGLDLLR